MKAKLHLWELDNEGFHLVVTGKLMGKTIRLLVDTGANHICFDRPFIEQLHEGEDIIVGRDEVNVGIGGSDFETAIAEIEGLKIGRLTIPKTEVRLIDLQPVNGMYQQLGFSTIQGIIGGDFLKRFHAVIDYNALELHLTK